MIQRLLFLLLLLSGLQVAAPAHATQACGPVAGKCNKEDRLKQLQNLKLDGSACAQCGFLMRVICTAEGNCDSNGNPSDPYFGHQDLSGKWNTGWCSATGQGLACARPPGSCPADDFCYNHCRASVAACKAFANADGWTKLNCLDLYNQCPACVTEAKDNFEQRLKEAYAKGLKGDAAIQWARAHTFFTNGRWNVDPGFCSGTPAQIEACVMRDQKRRMNDMNAAVTCNAGGDLGGGGGGSLIPSLPRDTIDFLKCWSCGLIEVIVNVGTEMGEAAFNGLKDAFKALISMLLGFFLLFHTAKLLFPFGPVEAGGQTVSRILSILASGAISLMLLTSMDFYWETIYFPVLDGSVNLSQEVLKSITKVKLKDCGTLPSGGTTKDKSAALATKLSCQTANITETINRGIRVGWAMLDAMTEYKSSDGGVLGNLINFIKQGLLFVSACIIMAVYFYASLMFLFAVIEVVYRWTFLALVAVISMAAYTFRETRSLAMFAIKGMMESMVALTLMSMVAAISINLMTRVGGGDGNIEKYITDIQKSKILIPTLNVPEFWTIVFIGLICGSLMFKMKAVAKYLVGSAAGNIDFGQRLVPALAGAAWNQTGGRAGTYARGRVLQALYNRRFGKKGGGTPPAPPPPSPPPGAGRPKPTPRPTP